MNELQTQLIQYPFKFERQHFSKGSNTIGACISLDQPKRGYIGFYSAEDQTVGHHLLDQSVQWLRSKGVTDIYGPIDYSTWFSYRFLIASTGGSTFDWEPKHQDSVSHWMNYGFELCEEYHSRAYARIHSAQPKTSQHYQKFFDLGYRTRPIEITNHSTHHSKDSMKEIERITRINQNSFDRAFLSEPLDPDAYLQLYVPQFLKYLNCGNKQPLSFFILDPSGLEVGYFFLFEDQDDQGERYLVWKTLAIDRAQQGQGLATFGIHHALKCAEARGLDSMVAALIRKGAPSEVLLQKIYDLKWEHQYGVFKLNHEKY